ncbi:hypothetical protein [Leptospira weilii]|uniref:hypothetical protein n=1 Tax=Leptospira weilii TaxID=28184 RepID=UPI003B9687F2
MFVSAVACMVYNIPLVYISGEEITQRSQDNQIRHALTKLATFIFQRLKNIKKYNRGRGRIGLVKDYEFFA